MDKQNKDKLRIYIMISILSFLFMTCSGNLSTNEPRNTNKILDTDTSNVMPDSSSLYSDIFPYAVMDSRGKIITFTKPAEKIVVLDNAALDTIYSIGEWHRVVATHDFASYPPQASEIPKVSDAFNMNLEAIIELDPDLVFVFYETFVSDLEDAGLKVLYLESLGNDLEETTELITMWGRITGNIDRAEKESLLFDERVSTIQGMLSNTDSELKVFQDVGDLWTPGQNTLMNTVFELLKLDNIAKDVSGYVQMSPELIVDRNPDLIIALNPNSITTNSIFKDVNAVKNKRVIKMPSDALSNAGPRFALGIEELAKVIYPQIFGNE